MSINSFFKKISYWFKKIFNKQKYLQEGKESDEELKEDLPIMQINNNDNKMDNDIYTDTDTSVIDEKDDFFKLYNDVKDGKVDLDSLSYEEKDKINAMMTQEISLQNKKIDKLREENKNIYKEIEDKQIEKLQIIYNSKKEQ